MLFPRLFKTRMGVKGVKAFTLAELLIALALIGVIAAIAIPKIINAQQNSTFNSIAKEAIGMISDAYTRYKQDNNVTASTKPSDLTPYMNYVAWDTSTTRITCSF